jgi:hypothetical protein
LQKLIFPGLAAGGEYNALASAADYVCLPHNPDFNSGEKATNHYYSYIYGSEYEDNVFGNNLYDKDVPCAVCISKMANNILTCLFRTNNTC